MKERSFDEMVAYFNHRVSEMDIAQDYKMELLGMVAALGYKHEKTAQPDLNTSLYTDGFTGGYKRAQMDARGIIKCRDCLMHGVCRFEQGLGLDGYCSQAESNHVIRKAMEQRWIPVTERLPDEDYCTGRGIQHSESVLVTVVHHANDDDVFVDMACTVDGKWQLTYPFDDDPDIPKWCEIIAWMPLPEPYAERGTDGHEREN